MPSSSWQLVVSFVQNIQSSSVNAVGEVLFVIYSIPIKFIFLFLRGIQQFPSLQRIFVVEVPLVVRVIFKHLETFGDTSLHSHQSKIRRFEEKFGNGNVALCEQEDVEGSVYIRIFPFSHIFENFIDLNRILIQ